MGSSGHVLDSLSRKVSDTAPRCKRFRFFLAASLHLWYLFLYTTLDTIQRREVFGMITRLLCAGLLLACLITAQTSTSGSVDVSVVDASAAIVTDAGLELRNLETNDVRKASTQANGVYQF